MSQETIGKKVVVDNDSYRDTRSSYIRIKQDVLSKKSVGYAIGGTLLAGAFFVPGLPHLLPILSAGYYFLTNHENTGHRPPLMAPKESGVIDDHNKVAGKDSASKKAEGVVYIGNDVNRDNAEVWISIEMALRHLKGIGTTGSGKTEFIFALLHSILCTSSGIIDNDGKSAAGTARQLQYLVRRFGREDDLFYENFQTSSMEFNRYYKTSNNTNPISSSNAQGTYLLLVGLLPEAKGDNKIFAERAAMLGEIATNILFDKQNNTIGYTVSFADFLDTIQLANLLAVLKESWVSDITKKTIMSYLEGLNVENPETAEFKNLQASALDQHLYAAMHFTKALMSITGTYGHILNTRFGEFNFYDVVNRQRILKCMLPSLEKPKQEREHLNNLNLTMLKQTVSKFLDFKIAGPKEYTDYLPHDQSLSVINLDEANYLLTEGIGLLTGQVRSLRFSVWVWGQSLSALRDSYPSEMKEIEANTGINFYGALEDKDAIDDAIFRAGKVSVKVTETFTGDDSKGFHKGKDVRLKREDAVEAQTVKGQNLSEWLMVYKDKPIQIRSFYAAELGNKSDETRVNEFCHRFDGKKLPQDMLDKLNAIDRKPASVSEKADDQKPERITFSQYENQILHEIPRDAKTANSIMLAKIDSAIGAIKKRELISSGLADEIRGTVDGSVYNDCNVAGDEEILLNEDLLDHPDVDEIEDDEKDDSYWQ